MAKKVKQQEGYQIKQVLFEKAADLNAFGWNKVKNTKRTVKKKTYVNVRRKLGIAKINELKPIENKYNKWAKKKIKKNPVGGVFACLFMVIFFLVGVVGLYLGLTENIIGGKAYEKSIAVYNAAVAQELITAEDLGVDALDACTVDGDAVTVTDGYKAFVKKYVSYSFGAFVNNYTYGEDKTKLNATDDAETIDNLGKAYISQLVDLGYAQEDAAVNYDASIQYSDENGYTVKAGALAVVDGIFDGMIRPLIQGFGLGYAPLVAGFGILFLAGALCFVLFIILLIVFIRICRAGVRIAKRDEIIAECVKEGNEIVYGAKVKNRDLMTKTERKLNDMQKMVVRAIRQANEGDDEEDDE